MNWLSNFARPGLKKRQEKTREEPETPDNLWIKCPSTGELIYQSDLDASCWVTPAGFHMRIGPDLRFKFLFDDAAFEKIELPEVPRDPLKFKDDKRYVDRLKAARAKNGRADCMDAAVGRIGEVPTVVIVQDFAFMGGSLGMAAGEAFIKAAQEAVKRNAALVCVTASGGARMQEGVLSLMQMARTTLALQDLNAAGLPYIVVLTDPTTGGVSASYAMLGDVHIAEPNAVIGFAGPRIIEQTIRQKLPEGFQRAEFLREKGMVDMVIDRRQLRDTLATLLGILTAKRQAVAVDELEEVLEQEVETPPAPRRKRDALRRVTKAAKPSKARAAE